MSNNKSSKDYSDYSEFGRRLEPHAINVGLGVQAELARVAKVPPKVVNRIYRSDCLSHLHKVIYPIIYRGAFDSENEVWALLRLLEGKSRRLRSPDEWNRKLAEVITRAFAERPEPASKVVDEDISQELRDDMRTIDSIVDKWRSRGWLF